jgi:parallel beta-helix repeat protein
MNFINREQLISIYIIFALVMLSFVGILVFEGVVDEGGVEAATLIVGPGQTYTKIQDAINNANPGDTIYVWAGTYNENLIVNKTVTLIGNGSTKTIIEGGYNGKVIKISSNWVNVTGFNIRFGNGGIYISSNNVTISNSNINFHNGKSGVIGTGIYLDSNSGTNIKNNIIFYINGGIGGTAYAGVGIYLYKSNNNTIIDNTINDINGRGGSTAGPGIGIYLYKSNNNTIMDNTIYDINGATGFKGSNGGTGADGTKGGIGGIGAGIYLNTSTHNTIKNNYLKEIIGGTGGAGGSGGDGKSYINGGDGGDGDNGALGSGIYLQKSTNNTIIDNTINTVTGGAGGAGGKGGDGKATLPVHAASSGGNGGDAGNAEIGTGMYIETSPDNKIINNSINTINGGPGGKGGDGGEWNHCGGAKGGDGGKGGDGHQGMGVYFKSSTNISIIDNTVNTIKGGTGGKGGKGPAPWGKNGANGIGSIGKGIYFYTSNNNKIKNNKCSNNDEGIYFDRSSNNLAINNNLSNNNNGINLDTCSVNIITENKCFNNSYGIFLSFSTNMIISNNTCLNNVRGIALYRSSNNEILSNECFLNDYGIFIEKFKNNTIKDNFCNSNYRAGIKMESSDFNNLFNNTCINNSFYGIELYYSFINMIQNNTCNNNYFGIYLRDSDKNMIINNTCNLNKYDGITLFGMINNEDSNENKIIKNTCNSNFRYGIWLHRSYFNEFRANILNFNNKTGIYLLSSESCIIYENTISNNNVGINFTSTGNLNHVYHNNIISNTKQAIDIGTNNTWNNSQQEGNYWSDYTGLDNGAAGRLKGDGIGDTNLKHLNLDNYPFINRSGWLYPPIPIFNDPGDLDSDGCYEISWEENVRTFGYILEEDTNESFNNPIEIYNGTDLNIQIINNSNGTYFYRLKAYNENYFSHWSNTEDIIVDWLPDTPRNLTVFSNPHGNTLNLSWDLNIIDTIKYILEYKNETMTNWQQFDPISHPISTYNHTGLDDGVIYDYRIQARDHRDQESSFSEIISGTPQDLISPAAPTGLKIVSKTKDSITLKWNSNTETDLKGYCLFRSVTNDPSNWGESIGTFPKDIEEFIDTGLDEEITYYYVIKAFDEVPNYSLFSNIASDTTPDGTPPKPPTGLKISDETRNSLTLYWESNTEKDLVGYYIFKSQSFTGSYTQINQKPISETQYIDSGLKEDTKYYYKLKAVDDIDLKSDFSETVADKTLIGPYAPEVNNTVDKVTIFEDSYDTKSINLYYLFKDKNDDPLEFWCKGQNKINVSIYQWNGSVILRPEADWSGEEIITFFATDNSVQGITKLAVKVIVKPINDPPGPVEIILPDDKITIILGTSLEFKANCTDPDMPYGDKLTFIWTSDITGELGTGKNLKEIKLEEGEHKIIVTVTDSNNMEASNIVRVIVLNIDPSKDNDLDGMPNGWEIENKFNINDPTDAEQDYDNDGLTNLEEYLKGTDPRNPDTDGDNYIDKEDAHPLDKTKWEKESTIKKKEDSDSFNSILGIVIIIVILIVVILLFFLLVKRKKKSMIDQEPQPTAETEKQIQQQLTQQPQQKPPPQKPQNLYPPPYQPPSPPQG